MIKDKLGVDDKDVELLTELTTDPHISQHELAKKLKLSQPSVNVRLQKLKAKGVLTQAVGIDAKTSGVALVRVDFTCTDADKILNILKRCSFFVNGFVMSGTRNVSVFLIGEDLGKIEQIVKQYLRNSKTVSNIELSVVVDVAKQFVCSVDLRKEHTHACSDPSSCKACELMKSKE